MKAGIFIQQNKASLPERNLCFFLGRVYVCIFRNGCYWEVSRLVSDHDVPSPHITPHNLFTWCDTDQLPWRRLTSPQGVDCPPPGGHWPLSNGQYGRARATCQDYVDLGRLIVATDVSSTPQILYSCICTIHSRGAFVWCSCAVCHIIGQNWYTEICYCSSFFAWTSFYPHNFSGHGEHYKHYMF